MYRILRRHTIQQRPKTPILASSFGDPTTESIFEPGPREPSVSPLEAAPRADDLLKEEIGSCRGKEGSIIDEKDRERM